MPIPVSLTDTSTDPSVGSAATRSGPPSGVNLIAFDKVQDHLLDLSLVRSNLAQPLIDARPQCDVPAAGTLADQRLGVGHGMTTARARVFRGARAALRRIDGWRTIADVLSHTDVAA